MAKIDILLTTKTTEKPYPLRPHMPQFWREREYSNQFRNSPSPAKIPIILYSHEFDFCEK